MADPKTDSPSPAKELARMLNPFVFDIALPVAIYYILHGEGMSNIAALVISGCLPAVRVLWAIVRHQHPDMMACLMTLLFVASVVLALLSGNARFFLVKESFVTGILGIWIMVTSRRTHNLAYDTARPVVTLGKPKAIAAWERLASQNKGKFHSALVRVSMLWGFSLIAEAAARVYVALHYPVHTAVGLVNIPIIVIISACCILSGPIGAATLKHEVDREVAEADKAPAVEQDDLKPAWSRH